MAGSGRFAILRRRFGHEGTIVLYGTAYLQPEAGVCESFVRQMALE